MKKYVTKIMALLTCIMMLVTITPAAKADWTTLELDFRGLTAQAGGQWRMEELMGSFSVQQYRTEVGVLSVGKKGSGLMTLEHAANVLLVPDMTTMPEGYMVQESGYSVSITKGKLNTALVMLYADAGLFTLQAESAGTFALTNEAGETVLVFTTDDQGAYALPEAIPSGTYTVHQEDGEEIWPDFALTLAAYRGMPDQLVQVDAEYARANALEAPVPTEVPTPEPTEVPTPEPTEVPTPEPTEEPTPEPTEEPTPEPTEEPTPDPTEVPTPEPTEEPTPEPTEEPTPEPTEEPTPEPTEEPTPEPTEEPTPEPTEEPTPEPTEEPTPEPTEEPTPEPTEEPTPEPTEEPTPEPTEVPTPEPTEEPTPEPTEEPTPEPTEEPTPEPTEVPTPEPTEEPTPEPTEEPTPEPTEEPTPEPTEEPTPEPTEIPTPEPTAVPAGAPIVLTELPVAEDAASLSIRVYHDRNGNGMRNDYDPGIAGTLIELIPEGWDAPASVVMTDNDASPVFSNIPAGNYTLRVTLPQDMGYSKQGDLEHPTSGNIMEYSLDRVQLSPVLELAAGEERIVAIGATQLAAVTGKAWDDVNGDGIMQEDEPGQEGVHIQLTGVNNGLVYELITDEKGDYYLGQVKPGNYKMIVTTPEGTMFTKYSKTGGVNRSYYTTEGKRSDTRSFLLEAGQVFANRHIGVVGDGRIDVLCFEDANFNGLFDEGEALLQDVKIDAIKSNGKTITGTPSGKDGIASVGSLRNGTYSVVAVIPEGYAFTCTAEGGNQFVNSNGRRKDTVKGIELAAAGNVTVLLGAVKPASISGVAYLDDNFSGMRDKNEDVVSGLLIALLDENGEKLEVARTTVKGEYTFENLNPGTYAMRLEAKAGYAFTKLGKGNYFVNTGDGKGKTEPFAVAMGASVTGMDIGQIRPGTVQGSVFVDVNDNGMQDEGEGGFVDTVVRLMSKEGEHFAATIAEDGAFCFDAVMPGRYYLQYEFPGESTAAPLAKDGNTITSDGNIGRGKWFEFAVGDKVTAPLCGGLKLGSITGLAFADHNGNGLRDEDEEVLPNVNLKLNPTRKDLKSLNVTTRDDGTFNLKNLHPDTYTLDVSMPRGQVMSRTGGLGLPLVPGVREQSITLELAMGASWNDQLLGGVKPATLTGVAWMDENFDGLYDKKEIKPAGETLTVIDQLNGQEFSTVTIAKDGSFTVEGLVPGSYTLQHGPAIEGKAGDSTFTYENGMMIMRDVTVAEGEKRNDLKLGIICHTSIAGHVWVDLGGEITVQDEAEVTLTDAQGTVLATAISDEEGAYAFDGLMPGQYQLSVTLPEGRVVVEPGDERLKKSKNISVMTECNSRWAKSDVIDLKMSKDQLAMDIGAVLPGSLGDLCWLDLNANGLQDSDEGGIPGVKIELMRGGNAVAETVSDQYGFYHFADVYPASYTLRVTAPEEVQPTQQRDDIPLIVSILGQDGVSGKVTVVSDKANRNADLGFVLVEDWAYPLGYGEGATQDWTKHLTEE